jgi:ERCC4-related helicase
MLIDNQSTYFLETIKNIVKPTSKIKVQAGRITAYSLYSLCFELGKYHSLDILLQNEELDYLFVASSDIPARNGLNAHFIFNKLVSLPENINIKKGFCGSNTILIQNENEVFGFLLPSSDLDLQLLGTLPSLHMQIITPLPQNYTEQISTFFYNKFEESLSIKKEIQEQFENATITSIPSSQYNLVLNNIFNDGSRALEYDKLEQSGFTKSKIWSMLYDFQKDAALGAIDKIEKYNGCIIADSVGLGKTFEALAVIKYYQQRQANILVLCPKRLFENWNVFKGNDTRNILLEDRFNYKLLFHTDLSRGTGMSNEHSLDTFIWENFDLIVIDESHNFRNNNPSRTHRTRYQCLMEDVLKRGIKTKVLMLSATPVNNKLKDLKNQLYFITEEDDRGLRKAGIESINEVLRKTQTELNRWLGADVNRDDLIDRLDGRYFKILDLLTIARSRKHIQKYYNTAAIGKFPTRLKPQNEYAEIDNAGEFPDIGSINNEILRLNLANYNPSKYILNDKKEEYAEKYDYQMTSGSFFRQESREESLVNLMRVNFLKRLESSIASFQITIDNVLNQVNSIIYKIEHFQRNREELIVDFEISDEFSAEDISPDLIIGEKVQILIQDLDLIRYKDELVQDRESLQKIIKEAKKVTPIRDAKLDKLKDVISGKLEKPLNPNNKKVIIFTAYADTAVYLYKQIANWVQSDFGLYSALVTGGGTKNKTNFPESTNKFNEILINFSPVSKKRDQLPIDVTGEIDILIATDCISEGQNLQDCDFLINYDIHWNPVRIVQRFGRIDRLGSTNDQIQLVNFWPNLDLNGYINLINRVKSRMEILDMSATGDENLINTDAVNGELDYRTRQLKQLKERVVDLEDLQGGISIADLTFNDFKADLDHLSPTEYKALQMQRSGFYSILKSSFDEFKPGVIFCIKDSTPSDELMESNAIYPYYLVYVQNNGNILFDARKPKKVLDALRSLCLDTAQDTEVLIEEFETTTKNGQNLEQYIELFNVAIKSIKGAKDSTAIDSLANPLSVGIGGLHATDSAYELINYFIVK